MEEIKVSLQQNKFVGLVVFLASVLAICVIALVFYFIYLIIFYYYPRPFFIGHSEPLENFMHGYIGDLLSTLKALKVLKPGSPIIADIESHKSKYKGAVGLPLFPLDLTDASDPSEAAFLRLYFALGGNYDKGSIAMVDRLIPGCDLAETLVEEVQNKDIVPTEFKDDMKAIETSLKKVRKETKDAWKQGNTNNLLEMQLAFMLDKKKYVDKITNMYKFRKTGGFFNNITLLEITLFDYVKYMWLPPKGIVPKVWLSFPYDLDDKVTSFRDWMRSPKVNSWVMKLPAKIAGIETFNVEMPKAEPIPQVIEPGDTIETFGFLKGLIEIPKILMTIADFFKTIMAVAQALVAAITNPIAVLRMLIGMIVGVMMVILYFVIVMLDFLFYIPAAVVIACIDIFKTAGHIFFFIVVALFYVVVWLLDMVTGGLFLKIMRCENLPNKWYLQPGYFFDNKYLRGFMCNFTCPGRYIPSDDGGWCEKIRRGRPVFCPQQIIYNASKTILTGQGNPVITPSTAETKLMYKFVVPSTYYTMNEIDKKTKIVDYLKDKEKFESVCFKFGKDYSSYTLTACNYFHSLKKAAKGSALHDEYVKNAELIDKALLVCTSSCSYINMLKSSKKNKDYKKLKNIIDQVSFCPLPGETKVEETIDDNPDGKTVAHRVIYSLIAMSILMTTFAAIYFYARDKNFNFLALLNR